MAKELKVAKEDAIALFAAMGFGTAKKWDAARLQKKLNALDEAPEDELGDERLDDFHLPSSDPAIARRSMTAICRIASSSCVRCGAAQS